MRLPASERAGGRSSRREHLANLEDHLADQMSNLIPPASALASFTEPMSTIYPPYVIERSSRGERTYDIFSRLLMDRIVFLGTPVNDDVANIIIAQLLFLEADNAGRDIF